MKNVLQRVCGVIKAANRSQGGDYVVPYSVVMGPRGHINEQQMISFPLKCNENGSVVVPTCRVFVCVFADDDLLS